METPFIFGRIASGKNFTDREQEAQHLAGNFKAGVNTILISPRRWGKSSLVQQAAGLVTQQDKKIKFCFIDLYNVRTEQQFYQILAQEILRASSGKWADLMDNAKKFLGRFIPNLSFNPGNQSDFTLSLDWKEVTRQPDDILNMAEHIAKSKKIKFVFCIDEFQNIKTFESPLAFQKKLRSHWQKHQNVSYCLYGSKRNMMMEVFTSSEMPFYKFGDLMFLQKIRSEDWVPFLIKRFSGSGKKVIKEKEAKLLVSLAECHPYYVQQLAQQAWLRTPKICSEEIVLSAYDGVLLQLSLLFQNVTDSLTATQVNFLNAMLKGVEQFSAKQALNDYDLGTSANVLRIKDALVNKEILDINGNQIEFLDPMYKHWLQKYYFKIL
ncbi:MAG: ATP-binding protein [Cyclobacteriaceae bacterium]|nr:ATP-binding protein [Cyclobacteriaceae bacterium]